MEASKWIRVLSSPDSVSKRRLDPLRVGDDKMQDMTNGSPFPTFGNGLVHKWLIFFFFINLCSFLPIPKAHNDV